MTSSGREPTRAVNDPSKFPCSGNIAQLVCILPHRSEKVLEFRVLPRIFACELGLTPTPGLLPCELSKWAFFQAVFGIQRFRKADRRRGDRRQPGPPSRERGSGRCRSWRCPAMLGEFSFEFPEDMRTVHASVAAAGPGLRSLSRSSDGPRDDLDVAGHVACTALPSAATGRTLLRPPWWKSAIGEEQK